jgi:regulator of replication initiation timing
MQKSELINELELLEAKLNTLSTQVRVIKRAILESELENSAETITIDLDRVSGAV